MASPCMRCFPNPTYTAQPTGPVPPGATPQAAATERTVLLRRALPWWVWVLALLATASALYERRG